MTAVEEGREDGTSSDRAGEFDEAVVELADYRICEPRPEKGRTQGVSVLRAVEKPLEAMKEVRFRRPRVRQDTDLAGVNAVEARQREVDVRNVVDAPA